MLHDFFMLHYSHKQVGMVVLSQMPQNNGEFT